MTISTTKKIVALAVFACFFHDAYADEKPNKPAAAESSATSKQVVSDRKVDYNQLSISSESDVERSYELTGESSVSKLEKLSIEQDTAKKQARIDAAEVEDSLQQKNFILKNVPPEIRVMGDKAVKAYLQTNFIDKKDLKPVERKSTEVIWESDPATLAALSPITVQPVTSQSNVQLTAKTNASQASNEKALEALGLTADDLKSPVEKQPKNEKKKTDETKKPSHSVSDIRWNRVVIMGKVARADLTAEVKTPDGKKMPYNINNIEVGSYFNIAEREYLVDSITADAVVFTDVKNKKTHRVSVR